MAENSEIGYTPTVWASGDVITADLLNHLENGVKNEQIGPAGAKGDKGDDAVINIISQADYDALADKSGVYFIEG